MRRIEAVLEPDPGVVFEGGLERANFVVPLHFFVEPIEPLFLPARFRGEAPVGESPAPPPTAVS